MRLRSLTLTHSPPEQVSEGGSLEILTMVQDNEGYRGRVQAFSHRGEGFVGVDEPDVDCESIIQIELVMALLQRGDGGCAKRHYWWTEQYIPRWRFAGYVSSSQRRGLDEDGRGVDKMPLVGSQTPKGRLT